MEPLTALGLAANVLQFIDFTSKLVSAGLRIHEAGKSQLELDLGLVVEDLSLVSQNLQVSLALPGLHVALNANDQVGTPYSLAHGFRALTGPIGSGQSSYRVLQVERRACS